MAVDDKSFIQIKVENSIIEEHEKDEINKKIKTMDTEKVFYTLDDLEKITGFSKGHILNTFFWSEDFKPFRHKVGRKWVISPPHKVREFLLEWIKQFPHE